MKDIINPAGFCDLHIHSAFSDGSMTPEELIDAAMVEGLSAVALCDHNTLDGIPALFSAAEGKDIEAISGVEISTDYRGCELHVLGLFVSESATAKLNELLEDVRARKEAANVDLFHRLREAGYDVKWENIFKKDGSVVNRVHFSRELMRLGHILSVDEGFRGILSPKNGLYVPAKRPDALQVISLLKSLKVVSSLAHPLLNLSLEELGEFLPQAVSAGLVAMETDYTKFTREETAALRSMAAEHGLLLTGGSDFHGENKPDNLLGRVYGGQRIPAEYYVKLQKVYNT